MIEFFIVKYRLLLSELDSIAEKSSFGTEKSIFVLYGFVFLVPSVLIPLPIGPGVNIIVDSLVKALVMAVVHLIVLYITVSVFTTQN